MKNLKILVRLVALAWALHSCGGADENDGLPEEHITQEVTFSLDMMDVPSGSASGRKAVDDVSSIRLSIEDDKGTPVIMDQELSLIPFENSYISTTVDLFPGTYNLVSFLVLNDKGEVIYAAPLEGSEKAPLVKDPLPIPFVVAHNEITTVTPEVVPVADGENPAQFGYAVFGFQLPETFMYDYQVVSDHDGSLVSGIVRVVGRDDKGTIVFQNEDFFDAGQENAIGHIELYASLASYEITIDRPDYFPLSHIHTTEQLMSIEKVPVPNTEEEAVMLYLSQKSTMRGFFFYGDQKSPSTDEMFFVYLPIDPCNSFMRIDFAGWEHGPETLFNLVSYTNGVNVGNPEFPQGEQNVLIDTSAPKGDYLLAPNYVEAQNRCGTAGQAPGAEITNFHYILTLDYPESSSRDDHMVIFEWSERDGHFFITFSGGEYGNPFFDNPSGGATN